MSAIDFFRRGRQQGSSTPSRTVRTTPSLLDPWPSLTGDIGRTFEEMERMMQMWRNAIMRDEDLMRLTPDIDETDTHYMISFDMPGVPREDLNIEVTGNQLLVSGERKMEQNREGRGGMSSRSRQYGRFQEAIVLPESIDTEQIEARFENGVLNINIPKSEQATARKIEIMEGQGSGARRLASSEGQQASGSTTFEEPSEQESKQQQEPRVS